MNIVVVVVVLFSGVLLRPELSETVVVVDGVCVCYLHLEQLGVGLFGWWTMRAAC